jgi:hypothetical protein
MKKSLYQGVRSVLKRLYFFTKRMLPTTFFMKIGFNSMYIANSISVKSYKSKFGFCGIEDLPRSIKKSDTLFILGSGASVNEYTDGYWEEIAKHDSVGFNFWMYHDFVPSFYVYEENLDPQRNQIFYDLFNQKKSDYLGVPIIVKDIEYKGVSGDKIPEEMKNQVYLSTELTIGCKEEEINLFFKKGHKFIESKNRKNINVLLKKSGTLSYLISLAEQLGYKKIVLCGIDLNNSKYFYEEEKYREKYVIPTNYENKNALHPTNQNTNGNIPMWKIIFTLRDTILTPKGIKLLIGSKSSALYPDLPYFYRKQVERKGG